MLRDRLASATFKDQGFTLDAPDATIIAQALPKAMASGSWNYPSSYLCRYASGANSKRQSKVRSGLVDTTRLAEDVPISSRMLDFIGTP